MMQSVNQLKFNVYFSENGLLINISSLRTLHYFRVKRFHILLFCYRIYGN